MKWNDVELVDGKFYVVELERLGDGKPNNWVFAYKDNGVSITSHYVSANISDTFWRVCTVYDSGYVCSRDEIISLRPATRDDMACFWDYLSRWGYKYSLNTKKLRNVGDR